MATTVDKVSSPVRKSGLENVEELTIIGRSKRLRMRYADAQGLRSMGAFGGVALGEEG
jgi:hypothetical protein